MSDATKWWRQGYFRLTRDIPTLGGIVWKKGDVVCLKSVSLQSHYGNVCGLNDLSALEPVDPEEGLLAVEHQRLATPMNPWGNTKLPPQPTAEEIQQHKQQAEADRARREKAAIAAAKAAEAKSQAAASVKVPGGQKSLLDGIDSTPKKPIPSANPLADFSIDLDI